MKTCIVCRASCKNSQLSFHRIPIDTTRRKQWIESCGLGDTTNINFQTAFVCSKHFIEDDYDEKNWPKRQLLSTAIPHPIIIKKAKIIESPVQEPLPIEFINITTTQSPDGGDMYLQSQQNEEASQPTNIPKIPRYVGDLQSNHFGSPKSTAISLQLIKRNAEKQRIKICLLQRQNRKLNNTVQSFKDLLNYLKNNEILSAEANSAISSHLLKIKD